MDQKRNQSVDSRAQASLRQKVQLQLIDADDLVCVVTTQRIEIQIFAAWLKHLETNPHSLLLEAFYIMLHSKCVNDIFVVIAL